MNDIPENGFLGSSAAERHQQILSKYADVFCLLRDLNSVCHQYLRSAKFNQSDSIHVLSVAYFIRGLMTFQSLILLLEHGYIEDVCSSARTLLQSYYRLSAIANKPSVINRIMASAVNDQKKRLEYYKIGRLKRPSGITDVDLDAKIAEAEAEIKRLGGSMINDYELAKIGDCLNDYGAYLLMSDAAHTSPSALRSFLKSNEQGGFSGYNYGPHDRNLIMHAAYIGTLQQNNLTNVGRVINWPLPASFEALKNRSFQIRSDMPVDT
jgi:hypothetical protein